MDKNLYEEAIQYEQLTQYIYQAILRNESISSIQVEHNVDVIGRSGVHHQIDVLWRFRQAGIDHTVLVECKNYASCITLEKIRNFFGVVHDIVNAQGLVVTKTGYQSGAAQFARFYGIGLKELRKPNGKDWDGRIKDIHISLIAKTVADSSDKKLKVQTFIKVKDAAQQARLEALKQSGRLDISSGADMQLRDKNGCVVSEQLRWWLPRQLAVIDKEDGGPYTQEIILKDKYLLINENDSDEELVEIEKLTIKYYVESYGEEIISYGEQIVEAILKDSITDNVEYIKKRDSESE